MSLGIGEAYVADGPAVVRTVLGSCVAVVLHVPRLRISALCHAQMPEQKSGVCCADECPHPCHRRSSEANDLRYVACCLHYMLGELHRRGVNNTEMVCTLVGGANVVRNIDPRWSVASRNVDAATEILDREGIEVRYLDTGGTRGRVVEHICDLNRTKIKYHDAT